MAKYLKSQYFQFLTVPENPKSAFLLPFTITMEVWS